MIDVPVRVKDALRDGRLRKNYVFKIYEIVTGYLFKQKVSNSVSYTVQDTAPIKLVGRTTSPFTVKITELETTNSYTSVLDAEGTYSYTIPSPTVTSVVYVDDLDGATEVDLYHYSADGEWLQYDTIDNDTLVKESVKFDERMCSGSKLKFGLCEGSSLEFQYFNHENINGKRIEALVDVQYEDEFGEMAWHTIPMGWYTVSQCPMQFSTGIYKVTAYNKLKSDYLDQNANDYLANVFAGRSSVYFFELREALLDGYEINTGTKMLFDGINIQYAYRVTGNYYTLQAGAAPFERYRSYWPSYDSNYDWSPSDFGVASIKYSMTMDPTRAYDLSWAHGSIDDFETSLYDTYLTDLLTPVFGSSNKNAILSAMLSSYGSYIGCYTFFGAVLTKSDNTQEIYSKRAYDNNKYGAVGPISDLFGHLITGYKKLELYMPISCALFPQNGGAEGYLNGEMYGRAGKTFLAVGQGVSDWYPVGDDDAACGAMGGHIEIVQDNTTHTRIYRNFRVGFCANYCWLYNDSCVTYDGLGVRYYDKRYEFLFPDGKSTSVWQNGAPDDPTAYSPSDDAPFARPIDIEDVFNVVEYEVAGAIDYTVVDPSDLADITARDAVSAAYELSACYGRLDRETDLFAPIKLNNSRLLPANNLYPSNTRYPGGESDRANKAMYQKLWTDSQGMQKFRYLYITYKTIENGQEVEKVAQKTVNADGTTDYNMSDNWLLKNLVWTANQINTLATSMVTMRKDISWFPVVMWCAGLPYLETGDELEITNSEGTHTSYILQRQLNGIQNLQDTFIDGELDIF